MRFICQITVLLLVLSSFNCQAGAVPLKKDFEKYLETMSDDCIDAIIEKLVSSSKDEAEFKEMTAKLDSYVKEFLQENRENTKRFLPHPSTVLPHPSTVLPHPSTVVNNLLYGIVNGVNYALDTFAYNHGLPIPPHPGNYYYGNTYYNWGHYYTPGVPCSFTDYATNLVWKDGEESDPFADDPFFNDDWDMDESDKDDESQNENNNEQVNNAPHSPYEDPYEDDPFSDPFFNQDNEDEDWDL